VKALTLVCIVTKDSKEKAARKRRIVLQLTANPVRFIEKMNPMYAELHVESARPVAFLCLALRLQHSYR